MVPDVTDGGAAGPLNPGVEGGGDVLGRNEGGGGRFARQAHAEALGHNTEHAARLADGH